jgi:hypothetical protein
MSIRRCECPCGASEMLLELARACARSRDGARAAARASDPHAQHRGRRTRHPLPQAHEPSTRREDAAADRSRRANPHESRACPSARTRPMRSLVHEAPDARRSRNRQSRRRR